MVRHAVRPSRQPSTFEVLLKSQVNLICTKVDMSSLTWSFSIFSLKHTRWALEMIFVKCLSPRKYLRFNDSDEFIDFSSFFQEGVWGAGEVRRSILKTPNKMSLKDIVEVSKKKQNAPKLKLNRKLVKESWKGLALYASRAERVDSRADGPSRATLLMVKKCSQCLLQPQSSFLLGMSTLHNGKQNYWKLLCFTMIFHPVWYTVVFRSKLMTPDSFLFCTQKCTGIHTHKVHLHWLAGSVHAPSD